MHCDLLPEKICFILRGYFFFTLYLQFDYYNSEGLSNINNKYMFERQETNRFVINVIVSFYDLSNFLVCLLK